jgi:GTP-binding protein Era
VFASDAGRGLYEHPEGRVRLSKNKFRFFAVFKKLDRVQPRERLLEVISQMSERYDFAEIVPLSALRKDNLDALLQLIPGFLPESEYLFDVDAVTDRSQSFLAAESIREKLTLQLRQELPYGLTVQIERYAVEEAGVTIHAVIWVERSSQKGMVVGKGGSLLKKIGRAARLELKSDLGVPVHLELWVKVKDNWVDNEKDLQSLGYELP